MRTERRAPSTGMAPDTGLTASRDALMQRGYGRSSRDGPAPVRDGLTPSRNGVGPDRVIEIQRARILAAMIEVSCERGAGSVTVAHVVERAGVSRRTFYEIFEDREDCFIAAFDEAIARASRYVLDSHDPAAKWEMRVRSALTGLLTFLEMERGAGRLLIVASLGAGAIALERRKRVLAQIIAVIDEGHAESRAGSLVRGRQAELPPLTAEGIVGGVLSVLHSRLMEPQPSTTERSSRVGGIDGASLLALTGPLMSMIVLPYLGMAAARKELARPTPTLLERHVSAPADPLRDVSMRLTYRTVCVLSSVAANPGCSNREIGIASGVGDQGQISKLLTRLTKLGLIENGGAGQARGGPNAWTLTNKGREIEHAIRERTTNN
jgi:AcrR family transcriptional regulator